MFAISFFDLTSFGQIADIKYKTFFNKNYELGDLILAPTINFACSGGEHVLQESYSSVKVIADFLLSHPTFKVEIGVYTDLRGGKEMNKKLSKIWSERLKEVLIKYGIKAERMISVGYGELTSSADDEIIKKAASDEKEKLCAKNRRIEIKLIEI